MSLRPTQRFPVIAMLGLCLITAGCVDDDSDSREALIASVIVEEDQLTIRARPGLVASKYARMAEDLYAFYRGTVPLFRHDSRDPTLPVSRTDFALSSNPLPLGLGDAHPENFGVLVDADETLAIEPNDFDSADRYPYFWDLRRLTTGLVLGARLSNADDEEGRRRAVEASREIARATAAAYARAIVEYAEGAPPSRLEPPVDNPILADLFRRGQRDLDGRDELDELTELEGAERRLRRGGIDEDDPENVYLDLPAFAYDALPATLEQYRRSLVDPPPTEFFTLLDAVRELGSGVASRPRIRVIILVRGPTDAPEDDIILELKELGDSGSRGWFLPGVVADDLGHRIMVTSRAAWADHEAEPFWGVATWVGLPVQIRLESEAHKTLRTHRFEGSSGTPESLTDLGRQLGRLLARVHATPLDDEANPAIPIAEIIGDHSTQFADEAADLALEYADLVEADWILFGRALERLGPRLGLPEAATRPRPGLDLQALIADPSQQDESAGNQP